MHWRPLSLIVQDAMARQDLAPKLQAQDAQAFATDFILDGVPPNFDTNVLIRT